MTLARHTLTWGDLVFFVVFLSAIYLVERVSRARKMRPWQFVILLNLVVAAMIGLPLLFRDGSIALLILIAVAMLGMLAMLIALALLQLDPKGVHRRAVAGRPDTRFAAEKRWATILAWLPAAVGWATLSNIVIGFGRAHALVVLSAGSVALAVLLTYAVLTWRGALAPARFLRGRWILMALMVSIAIFSGITEV